MNVLSVFASQNDVVVESGQIGKGDSEERPRNLPSLHPAKVLNWCSEYRRTTLRQSRQRQQQLRRTQLLQNSYWSRAFGMPTWSVCFANAVVLDGIECVTCKIIVSGWFDVVVLWSMVLMFLSWMVSFDKYWRRTMFWPSWCNGQQFAEIRIWSFESWGLREEIGYFRTQKHHFAKTMMSSRVFLTANGDGDGDDSFTVIEFFPFSPVSWSRTTERANPSRMNFNRLLRFGVNCWRWICFSKPRAAWTVEFQAGVIIWSNHPRLEHDGK